MWKCWARRWGGPVARVFHVQAPSPPAANQLQRGRTWVQRSILFLFLHADCPLYAIVGILFHLLVFSPMSTFQRTYFVFTLINATLTLFFSNVLQSTSLSSWYTLFPCQWIPFVSLFYFDTLPSFILVSYVWFDPLLILVCNGEINDDDEDLIEFMYGMLEFCKLRITLWFIICIMIPAFWIGWLANWLILDLRTGRFSVSCNVLSCVSCYLFWDLRYEHASCLL